jgi:hypothetical protein
MDKITRILLLIIGAGILLNLIRENFFSRKKHEIEIAGIRVDKEPCMSAMNELFGSGLDSSKMCECLLPQFYELIKHDPLLTREFRQTGYFTLEGTLNDLFGICASRHITDTNATIQLTAFKKPFLDRLKDSLARKPHLQPYNLDSLSECLFEALNGKITIKEYLSPDYLKVDKIRLAITNCIEKHVDR